MTPGQAPVLYKPSQSDAHTDSRASLMELDPTNLDWADVPCLDKLGPNHETLNMHREDPFDFYEDALGG